MGKRKVSMSDKNVLQKLQEARVKLLDAKLTKSGVNKHLGYKHFELDDILPTITRTNADLGLLTQFRISLLDDKEIAELLVIDSENMKDMISFSTPTAEMKAQQPIQGLGGKITYLRRYLLMVAYEISEKDTVEAEANNQPQDLPQDEIEAIEATRDMKELTAVCGDLKKKYGHKLVLPHFQSHKATLEQQESA